MPRTRLPRTTRPPAAGVESRSGVVSEALTVRSIVPYVRATVVIPTLNARELFSQALEALEQQTVEHDVIVVDNASTDGTAELLAERFPHVQVVRVDENLGFGRAVNRGVEHVESDALVLINNDVVCEPAFIERIIEPLAAGTASMAAGVLLQHER